MLGLHVHHACTLVAEISVIMLTHQQRADLCAALLSSLMEWGEVPAVSSIDLTVELNQKCGQLHMLGKDHDAH